MDFTLYKALNGFAAHHDAFEDVIRFFAQDAQYFFVALLAIHSLASGARRTRDDRLSLEHVSEVATFIHEAAFDENLVAAA